MTDERPTFYIIWNPNYHEPPRVQFTSRKLAARTAADMAARFGDPFYVCKAIRLYKRRPTEVDETVLR